MDGLSLLERAVAAGMQVSERNGQLVVRGPKSLAGIAHEVLANKQDVLLALGLRAASGSDLDPCASTEIVPFFTRRPGLDCRACGRRRWWRLKRLGDRGDWICGRCHPPGPPRRFIEFSDDRQDEVPNG